MDDVTVVLRECGERTADASCALLQAFLPAANVVRINELPFSRAVRKAFEVGLDEKRPWTLCIDADVLVSERGIRELLAIAEMQPPQVFELQGFIADKFFGFFRPAGNHLYRTAMLSQARGHIPTEAATLRPEHSTILAMRQASFVDVQLPTIVGIHDYEQFYNDIFRKCFLQAHKHDWLRDFLTRRWGSLSLEDDDYRLALSAFQMGESHRGEVFVDKRFAQEEFQSAEAQLGLSEKPRLAAASCGPEVVQAEIQKLLSSADSDAVEQQALVTQHYFVNPLLLPNGRRAKRSLASRIKKITKSITGKLRNR